MDCANPFFIAGTVFPCGKCIQCRIRKTSEWAARMCHELESWSDAVFVTLTYKEMPENNSLKKRDFQLFFKRLRKYLGKRKVKFFACGEYGGDTQRPHYHAIIFGLKSCQQCICHNSHVNIAPKDDCALINDAWGKGFVKIGSVTFQSCRYVAKYIQKKKSGKQAQKEYFDTNREPMFQLQSKGLGLEYAIKHKDQIVSKLSVPCNGRQISIPNYYRKKIDLDDDTKLIMSQLSYLRFQKYLKRVGIDSNDVNAVMEEIKRYGKQRALNLLARIKLNKKGGEL